MLEVLAPPYPSAYKHIFQASDTSAPMPSESEGQRDLKGVGDGRAPDLLRWSPPSYRAPVARMYPQVEDWSSERLLADGIGDLRPSVDDAAVSCASDSDLPRGPTSHTVDTFTASGPLQSYDGKSCSDTQQLSELDEALCLFAKETEGSDDLSTYELGVQRFWTLNQECGGDIGQTRGRFMDEVLTAVEKGLDRSIVTERMWSTRKTRARKMIRRHLARVVAGPALEHLKVPVHVSYPRKAGLNTSLAGPAHRPLKVPVTHDPHSRRASLNATFIKSSILQEPSRFLARLELLRSEDESAAIDRLVEEAWNESHAGSTSELAMAGGRTSSNTRKRHGRFREAAIEHMSRETDLICDDNPSLAEIRSELHSRLLAIAERSQ